MYKAYQNTLAGYCDSDPDFCTKLGKFLSDNVKWITAEIASNPGDKYWYHVSFTALDKHFVVFNFLLSFFFLSQTLNF